MMSTIEAGPGPADLRHDAPGSPTIRRTPRVWWDRRRGGTGARARGERSPGRRPASERSGWSAGALRPTGSRPCRSARRSGVGWEVPRAHVPPRHRSSTSHRGVRGAGRPDPRRPAGRPGRPAACRARTPRDRGQAPRTRGDAAPTAARAMGPPRLTVRSLRPGRGSTEAQPAACCPSIRPKPPDGASSAREGAVLRAHRRAAGNPGSASV